MGRSPLDSAFSSGGNQQKSKRSFFYLLLLGVAGMATASSVFAASVTINSGSAISYTQGVQTIAACDTDGITAALGAFYDTNTSEFVTDTITLTLVSNDCDGKTLTLEMYDTNDDKLVTIVGAVKSDASTTVLIGQADIALDDGATLTAASAAATDLQSSPTLTYGTTPSTFDAGDLAASATRIVIEIN